MNKFARAGVLAAIGLAILSGKAQAQDINVVINGQPVGFTGTPPQEVDNSVLVPLRGVFEQLGADVQYNPSTKTIFAQKGSTNVSLALGSSTAYVNNQAEQLAQPPAVILGTTLVPLRFVAESFGAYVEWEPETHTVQIQTGPSSAVALTPPPPPPVPEPPVGAPPMPGSGQELTAVTGHVINVDNPGDPTVLTVGTPGGPTAINLDAHTRIMIHQTGVDPRPGQAHMIHRGDEIHAQLWPNGNARYIAISFSAVKGTIVAVQNVPDGTIVVLDSGQILRIDPHAGIYQAYGSHDSGLHPGESIYGRQHPGDERVYSVDTF